jgi:DNA-binding NtrC family response regulator
MFSAPSSLPLVLIVDDEIAIREAVRDILELSGVESLLAAAGDDALDRYREYQDRIRLIILDLSMPRMNGVEAYHALRRIDKHVPVVLSSGHHDHVAGIDLASDPNLSLLHKPYAIDDLLAQVPRAIES